MHHPGIPYTPPTGIAIVGQTSPTDSSQSPAAPPVEPIVRHELRMTALALLPQPVITRSRSLRSRLDRDPAFKAAFESLTSAITTRR